MRLSKMTETPSKVFDYIIVGGGTAGCVLASRLSEWSDTHVLLLEAGRDTPPGGEPEDVTDIYPLSYYDKSNMWPGLKMHWRTEGTSPLVPMSQARIMGGGSSVMGMIALRGTPADYDEWAALGATGWNWQGVLPYFRKLENDYDHGGPMHGKDGPTPIRRIQPDDWPHLTRAIGAYAAARGIPFVADRNGDFRDGFGPTPISSSANRRISSAMAYLGRDVRARPNLTIGCETVVASLLVEGNRVRGVVAERKGAEQHFDAKEVILCGGAIFSPAMLLKSGIGPAEELSRLGIGVVADRPGVGRNMQNHPALYVACRLRQENRQRDRLRTHPTAGLRRSSGLPGCPETDTYINIQSKSSWNEMGKQIANLSAVLLKPASRGRVTLAAPNAHPRVEFNFLDDPRDLDRLAQLYIEIVAILSSREVRPLLAGEPFPVRYMDRLRRLNEKTARNARQSYMIARLLDLLPEGVAYRFLMSLAGGRVNLQDLVQDEGALQELVGRNISGSFHIAGTCRMGFAADPESVVDPAGRVYGVSGLRVVDASIMPTVPRGNTNIPTVMIAEKIADSIREYDRASTGLARRSAEVPTKDEGLNQ